MKNASRYDPERPDVLTWLQTWYAIQTDGDWEHEFGVQVRTLSNPGWSVEIDLAGTALAGLEYERHQVHRSDDDWLDSWVEREKWHLACGPLNLAEGLHIFRMWAGDTGDR